MHLVVSTAIIVCFIVAVLRILYVTETQLNFSLVYLSELKNMKSRFVLLNKSHRECCRYIILDVV